MEKCERESVVLVVIVQQSNLKKMCIHNYEVSNST